MVKRIFTNRFHFMLCLTGINFVQDAVFYENKLYRKKYILLIMENGDFWRISCYTYNQAMQDARRISRMYAERRDGTIYLAKVTEFH